MRFKVVSLLAAAFSLGVVQAASAADMPVKAVPFAPVYNWTGFYVGGHIGGAWSRTSVSDPTGVQFAPLGATIDNNGSGFLGGFQLGYNYQAGNWVFGLQGDMSWTGINASVVDPFFANFTLNDKVNWLASLNGRIGYAWNTWLLYGKGGVAWVHNTYGGVNVTAPILTASSSDTRTGYLLGAGLEYAFARNWTTFIEYDYIGLGTHTTTLNTNNVVLPAIAATVKQNLNLVKLGLDYKF